jgi:hypothetical protein
MLRDLRLTTDDGAALDDVLDRCLAGEQDAQHFSIKGAQ